MDFRETHMIETADGAHFCVGSEFDQFAVSLFETGAATVLDDEGGQLRAYENHCQERIRAIEDSDSNDPDLVEMLQLEKNTWALLYRLLDIRVVPEETETCPDLTPYSSDQSIVSAAIKTTDSLAEMIAVKEWLEESAPDFIPVETRKGFRPYTLKSVREQSARSVSGAVSMDPDGPLRTGISLAPDDAGYDHALNKTLFSFVRRGQFAQAADFCRAVDEPWRAASFAGINYHNDAFVDGVANEDEGLSGNVNRDLWKETCYMIAKEPSADLYERAYYAVMCGNVDNVAPVCKTWEDFVWAHFNSYIESILQESLTRAPQTTPPNGEYSKTQSPETSKLPADLFEWLNRNENPDICRMAQNPFRIFQAMLILNRVDPLLETLHHQFLNASSSIPQLPTVLRFIAHLILALRSVSYPLQAHQSADFLLKTYIDLLIAAKKDTIVAVYVGQLPSALQIETFAQFLEGLAVEKEMRAEYVAQGKDCGIDMWMACRRAVELTFLHGIFKEAVPTRANSVFVTNMGEEIPDAVFKQVRALEWLLFDPLQQADALIQCTRLIRRFLVHGQIHVLKEILTTVPPKKEFLHKSWLKAGIQEANLDARDTAALENLNPSKRRTGAASFEFLCYTSLVEAFEGLVNWNSFLGVMPKRSNGDSDTVASFQFRDWMETMKSGTVQVEATLRGCLEDIMNIQLNNGGFSGQEGQERLSEIQMIRDIYATEIILRLQHVLFETREYIPENLEKCIYLLQEYVEDGPPTSFHAEFIRSGKVVFFMQQYKQAKKVLEERE
ncbi:hypothetical protein HDU98_008736 [Podochytrium sp. JEL0797]|nr:hypothetical protein HDU98_008736 [Podochytrium sp. JEL0797]